MGYAPLWNTMTFAELNLAAPLLQAIEAMGYTSPTSVQEATIPASMNGGDWMVSSQTGSGKTAAFLLPALHALIQNPGAQAAPKTHKVNERSSRGSRTPGTARPQVLVLCPTRELAQQVAAEAIQLVQFTRGIRIATVLGGTAYMMQLRALEGASLVVATPGRLLDLHRNKQINLDDVHTLVVDEADRMLDLGFSEDLEAIHQATEDRDRTLMFSATFANRIMQLASAVMRDPQKIELATAQDTHQNIEQRLHWFDDAKHKEQLLEHYLNDKSVEQAIVFTATQIETDELSDRLRVAGYRASALHGGLPQAMRNRRIQSLREGHIQFLVATDVAARGIDVPAITHVINYGLPMKPEDYTHRIGRTGRAGRNGLAITLAGARDRYKIRNIERFTQQAIAPSEIEGLAPTQIPQPHRPAPRGRPEGGFGGGGRFESRGERPARRDDFRGGSRAPRAEAHTFAAPAGERPAFVRPEGAAPAFNSERPPRSARPAHFERSERSEKFVRTERDFGSAGGYADRPPRFERNTSSERAPRSFDSAPRSFDRAPRSDSAPQVRNEYRGDNRGEFRTESRTAPRTSERGNFGGDRSFAPRREHGAENSFNKPPRRDFGAPTGAPRAERAPYAARESRPAFERDEFSNGAAPRRREFSPAAGAPRTRAPGTFGDKPAFRNTDAGNRAPARAPHAKGADRAPASDKKNSGPAYTPPHPDGNRSIRRAEKQAAYNAANGVA